MWVTKWHWSGPADKCFDSLVDLLTNVLILSVKRGSDGYVLFVLSYIGSSTVILYPAAKKLFPLLYRGI